MSYYETVTFCEGLREAPLSAPMPSAARAARAVDSSQFYGGEYERQSNFWDEDIRTAAGTSSVLATALRHELAGPRAPRPTGATLQALAALPTEDDWLFPSLNTIHAPEFQPPEPGWRPMPVGCIRIADRNPLIHMEAGIS